MKTKITVKELTRILKLSEPVVRMHLARFEKYRVPYIRPLSYQYNYNFLLDLRQFYVEKSEGFGWRNQCYKEVVERLNKIIKLWDKMNRTNFN